MIATRLATRRGIRLFAAELLVGAGIAASLALGLSMVAGHTGLGWVGDVNPRLPVAGQSASVMAIDTTFNSNARFSMTNAPRWRTDLASGDVDAATGKPPVEVNGPFTGNVTFWGPTHNQRWAWVFWKSAGPLLVAASLFVVLGFVRSLRTGNPFTSANARRLRILALLIGVGGTAVLVAGELVRRWLLDTSAAAGLVELGWHLSFAPLLAGALIGVVAEVWRAGVAMRDDLEGVV